MIDEARALYQLPPKDFVAARTRLVKELKAARRGDEAAQVTALRRPRLSEHALDLATEADPSLVERFATAVTAATAAQRRAIEHGEGGALRTATEELRNASNALAEAAVRALDAEGEHGDGQRMEIQEILRGALSANALEQLRTGTLGSAPIEPDTEEEDVVPAPRRAGPAKKPKAAEREVAPKPSVKITAAERRERAAAAKEHASERRRLERDVSAAEARVDAATRVVKRAGEALRSAEAAMKAAETELAAAQREADAARAALDAR